MSTSSQFPPDSSASPSPLRALFAAAVIVRERREPGDAADLLPAEAQYVARAQPKRIREFAAGRACARAALAQFEIRDVALRAAPDRQPVWPDGIVGSITHTDGFCAAVVARRSSLMAVGLDSEVVGAPTAELWETICREEELAWLRSLPEGSRAAGVTLLFSAKETFYKCQYPVVGEWLDFHDLRVEVRDWGGASGTFAVHSARTLKFARHVELPVVGGYLFHERFVSAGIGVPAAPALNKPCRRERP